MKCFKCNNTSNLKLDNKDICQICFVHIIEKKVRKEIRINKLFKKNEKVLFLLDGSEKAEVLKYLIKKIIKNPAIKFSYKKIKIFYIEEEYDKNNEYDKILVPWCIENEIEYYLSGIFTFKDQSKLLHGKIIKPLIGISRKDINNFAKIKKLQFKKSQILYPDIEKMIDKLEKRYPGTKSSILKTIKEIK